MTETEWLACRTSRKLLAFLRGRLTERKLRLIGCGCCHVVGPFALAECRTAAAVADRIADRVASATEMAEGYRAANYARDMATGTMGAIPRRYRTREAWCASWAVHELVVALDPDFPGYLQALHDCVSSALDHLSDLPPNPAVNRLNQSRVVRDVVGNPFRTIQFDPAWRTSNATLLAQGIYAERAFDRLPILADALQDAGCDNDDILNHCRDPAGPHVRGCWVVDSVLSRE
ncbi:hypothetical protein VT84_18000 [Gemmata sp. SH-PL17]|uniref:hypothetical protein n=1 Tax=Gemmata sp. SH-PL17 TaxID=1630693 RepID=UPI00078C2DC2|nr:hypothetical protein [Gemmata sp. SH-PL17]AMV26296.1 hypothetical protein VT84_18000 [Gemmata sp. SH-PL17]